jgi:two pore calcium channel protein
MTWRELSRRSKIRLAILTAIFALSTIDLATSTIREKYPSFSNFMRPIVIMIMMSQVRATTKSVVMNFKDSLTVMTMIFLYITFFSVVGVFLFKDSYEGFSLLTGVSNAYYQLLILLTTCNFPNVMLPAYNSNRSHCIFFIVFLLIGLMFLFKVLLAVVFENFKKRVEMRFENKTEDRIKMIRKYF